MSEEDIRKHLSRKQAPPKPLMTVRRPPGVRRPPPKAQQDTYEDFSATHLMCPTCRQAMPVRERLMLILPDGNLYDYSCTECGTSVGRRKA